MTALIVEPRGVGAPPLPLISQQQPGPTASFPSIPRQSLLLGLELLNRAYTVTQ